MKDNYIDDFIDYIRNEKGAKNWEDVVSYCWYNMAVYINYLNIDDEYYDPRNEYLNRLDRIVKLYYWSKYCKSIRYSISAFVRDLVNLFAKIVKENFDVYYEFQFQYEERLKRVL